MIRRTTISEKEYIEREAALDIAVEWCPDDDGSVGKTGDLREMLDELEAIPAADVVEVVKCAECKYAEFEREDAEDGIQLCWYCHYNGCWFRANDFCSYGERKMDGGVNDGKAD